MKSIIPRILLPVALLWGGAYFNSEILPDGWAYPGKWYSLPLVVTQLLLFVASFAPLILFVPSDDSNHDDFYP